jgi:hypothetical protein
MTDLDDGRKLTDVLLHSSIQALHEEVLVVIQLEGQRELVLERLPDFVVFTVSRVRAESHLVHQVLVKLGCIFPVLA